MASGDGLQFWDGQSFKTPDWLYVAFTSGGTSAAPAKGDTIWGDTSNANAVLQLIVITSGSFAGGDAAGWMFLSNWNGTAWTSGENWTPNTTTAGNRGTFTGVPVSCFATPNECGDLTPCIDFDSAVNEAIAFIGQIPSWYTASAGFTFKASFLSTTTTGDISVGAMIRSIGDNTENLGAVGTDPSGLKVFAEPQMNTIVDAPSTVGFIREFTISFTFAQADSPLVGEYYQIILFRDARDSSNDDMAADARVVSASLFEA